MHDPNLILIIILIFTGMAAGIVDAIAGGGGLIVVPMMLLIGLPPIPAMGSNKLQACFGEFTAMLEFHRKGHIELRKMLLGFIMVAFGATLGTLILQYTHPELLNKLLPILLTFVLIYTILSPRPSEQDLKSRMSVTAFYILWGLVIGFYNGYFGPGTGSFWIVAFMFFLGFNIKKASMYAKPVNLTGNLVALVCFISAGQIIYWAGFSAAIGQVLGSKIGAHLVMTRGQHLVRPVFITVVSLMILSLIVKHYF